MYLNQCILNYNIHTSCPYKNTELSLPLLIIATVPPCDYDDQEQSQISKATPPRTPQSQYVDHPRAQAFSGLYIFNPAPLKLLLDSFYL